jgi:hypothetical protein
MEELLSIALDPRQPMALYAATVYGDKVKRTPEAANLLNASSPVIKRSALKAMYGASYDRSIWQMLERELYSSNAGIRGFAALVAGADKGEVPAAEKAKAIVTAMTNIESLPAAQTKFGLQGFEHMKFPEYELAYENIIEALWKMGGLEPETLRELTPPEPGNARDCVLVVRTIRDDDTARAETGRVALENRLFLIRLYAATALRRAGTPEAIDTLRKVAAQDPTSRTNWVPTRTATSLTWNDLSTRYARGRRAC